MRPLIIASLLSTIVQAVLIINALRCLPDTESRLFMGRGSMGQCLYRVDSDAPRADW